jgi:DNA-directed RNA polymerase specialized sigma24 family protein
MTTPRGERAKKTLGLDSRTRRRLVTQVMTAQEAVDRAEDALADAILKAYEEGLSYANIGGALGMHPTSAKERIDRARERRDGS